MSHHTSELRVADLMTRSVYTLGPMQSLPLAESLMSLRHVRHIPVVDDEGAVVGIVTHRDLLASKISSLAPLSDDERSSLQLAIPVSRVMQAPVWTIGAQSLAITAARILREQEIGCLPVVERGKLVGILTEADLLTLVTDSLSLERPARQWTMERVMTPVPVTITPDATLADARTAMARYRIRHLPVVDRGKPVAVVCDRQLAIAEAIFREMCVPAAHVTSLLGKAGFRRVAPDAGVDAVLEDMFENRLEAVLVVDPNEHLIGIFTPLDACRLARRGNDDLVAASGTSSEIAPAI